MTRNQKIALGCGGAGCLGLIVVTIAGVFIYFFYSGYRDTRVRIANHNYNRNSNLNSNTNTNENSGDSTNSTNSSSSTTAELSQDEKHRLFQAAAIVDDYELQRRVWVKIGILEDDFSQGNKFGEFAGEHIGWVLRNYQWISTVNSPEKARAYIDEHLPD